MPAAPAAHGLFVDTAFNPEDSVENEPTLDYNSACAHRAGHAWDVGLLRWATDRQGPEYSYFDAYVNPPPDVHSDFECNAATTDDQYSCTDDHSGSPADQHADSPNRHTGGPAHGYAQAATAAEHAQTGRPTDGYSAAGTDSAATYSDSKHTLRG